MRRRLPVRDSVQAQFCRVVADGHLAGADFAALQRVGQPVMMVRCLNDTRAPCPVAGRST